MGMLNVPPYSAFLNEILEEGKERTDMVLLFGVLAHCKRTFFLSPYKQPSASLAMKSRNSKCVDVGVGWVARFAEYGDTLRARGGCLPSGREKVRRSRPCKGGGGSRSWAPSNGRRLTGSRR